MMIEESKPTRQRRARMKTIVSNFGVAIPSVDAAQRDADETFNKNKRNSERLLELLKLHHRHGFGEYEKLDKGDVLIGEIGPRKP